MSTAQHENIKSSSGNPADIKEKPSHQNKERSMNTRTHGIQTEPTVSNIQFEGTFQNCPFYLSSTCIGTDVIACISHSSEANNTCSIQCTSIFDNCTPTFSSICLSLIAWYNSYGREVLTHSERDHRKV